MLSTRQSEAAHSMGTCAEGSANNQLETSSPRPDANVAMNSLSHIQKRADNQLDQSFSIPISILAEMSDKRVNALKSIVSNFCGDQNRTSVEGNASAQPVSQPSMSESTSSLASMQNAAKKQPGESCKKPTKLRTSVPEKTKFVKLMPKHNYTSSMNDEEEEAFWENFSKEYGRSVKDCRNIWRSTKVWYGRAKKKIANKSCISAAEKKLVKSTSSILSKRKTTTKKTLLANTSTGPTSLEFVIPNALGAESSQIVTSLHSNAQNSVQVGTKTEETSFSSVQLLVGLIEAQLRHFLPQQQNEIGSKILQLIAEYPKSG